MMECVNLKERFGKRYRVRYEESYYVEHGSRAWGDDPWLQVIPCDLGHIFPHGGNLLAASTNRRGATAKKLMALPGVTVHQDGDDGVTVLFPVESFDQVAALMRPKRRRVVSEAERQRLRLLGAKYGFQHGCGARGASAICVGSPLVEV